MNDHYLFEIVTDATVNTYNEEKKQRTHNIRRMFFEATGDNGEVLR